MNPALLIDFYKDSHADQYPEGITKVFTNFTARHTREAGATGVVVAGIQRFISTYLIKSFNENFFNVPWGFLSKEIHDIKTECLGHKNPNLTRLQALHELGYLPIKLYAVPEGTFMPFGAPLLVCVNTLPEFFWLPNYLETLLSNQLWKPITSATKARKYRQQSEYWADKYGVTGNDRWYIDYQCHDFSMRGMSGIEDAIISGIGHLMFFKGTDTVPAILDIHRVYGDSFGSIGGSVPATEHSVMCAGGKEDELSTFKRIINLYKEGPVSIVSDTWDFWQVMDQFVPQLKDLILQRDGVTVFRPDSGDPVKIVIGDPESTDPVVNAGALATLAKHLGVTDGYINKGRIIYGDSITTERQWSILEGTVNKHNLHPGNVVFGVGSYTYEYVTRDTHGMAMKATAIEINGEIQPIFKEPKTDKAKNSHKGIPVPYRWGNHIGTVCSLREEDLNGGMFKLMFENGLPYNFQFFKEVREVAMHPDNFNTNIYP